MLTIAEESTAWGGVSRPTYLGGLGFSLKWNMGWMNDTLRYMRHEPIHRKYHHDELTFSLIYAFHENFCLPLSHDEVVHGKGSLLDQMPGDLWQKFANLRLMYGYMWGHPGKKLLFMGGDFGQWNGWNFDESLQWHLLQWDTHSGLQRWVADLNRVYRREASLHQVDFDHAGFEWIDCHNYNDSASSFVRRGQGSAGLSGHQLQFHAGRPRRLSPGCARALLVRGNPQLRLDVLRRQQRRQWVGRDGRANPVERPPLFDPRDAGSLGDVDVQAAKMSVSAGKGEMSDPCGSPFPRLFPRHRRRRGVSERGRSEAQHGRIEWAARIRP